MARMINGAAASRTRPIRTALGRPGGRAPLRSDCSIHRTPTSTTNGRVKGSGVRLSAMVASPAIPTAARITSERMDRCGSRATAITGGADMTSSREATTRLWRACGAWAGLTIPKTIVNTPKPTAETAMMAARTRIALILDKAAVRRLDGFDEQHQSVPAVDSKTLARGDPRVTACLPDLAADAHRAARPAVGDRAAGRPDQRFRTDFRRPATGEAPCD